MKCAKCGYLGFEPADRCRNCGCDFSLASAAAPDLSMRPAGPADTLDDLSLIDGALAGPHMTAAEPDLDRVFGAPESAPPARIVVEPTLFGPPIPDDEPLITRASPPRPPLAVRRATPEAPRLRTEPRVQALELEWASTTPTTPAARATAQPWPNVRPESDDEDASVGARVIAMALDLTILAAIDALVIYFTMQICGISLADLSIVPKSPLFAFLFMQNFGYLVAFTAGGQTLGKMATGIRVVPHEARSSLDVGRACVRSVVWLMLAIPVGLGFITAFLRRDRRGIHDRFAGTRVVRVSA
jgi:uncharacterized RDD family membrane protein YckC